MRGNQHRLRGAPRQLTNQRANRVNVLHTNTAEAKIEDQKYE
jgi:hypothetical protein